MRTGHEVRPAEQMNKQITRDARPVRLPFAPLEKLLGIKRNLWRGAQKLRPVACLGGSIQRNRIVPCASRRVAIPPCGHHVELTNGTGSQQFFRLGVDNVADALASDLNHAIGALRRLDHFRAIRVLMNHRLFAIHIFAGMHCVDGDLLMPVIRRGHNHGVNVFASENLFIVHRGKDIVPPQFLAMVTPSLVGVANRNQLDSGNLHCSLRNPLAPNTRTDQCKLNRVIRRLPAWQPRPAPPPADVRLARPEFRPSPVPQFSEKSCDSDCSRLIPLSSRKGWSKSTKNNRSVAGVAISVAAQIAVDCVLFGTY